MRPVRFLWGLVLLASVASDCCVVECLVDLFRLVFECEVHVVLSQLFPISVTPTADLRHVACAIPYAPVSNVNKSVALHAQILLTSWPSVGPRVVRNCSFHGGIQRVHCHARICCLYTNQAHSAV